MKSHVLYEVNGVKWMVFARNPEKPDSVIDTNEYLITTGDSTILLDPGGIEIFPEVVSAISDHVKIGSIKYIFGSHQDPDILSSLSLWQGICPEAEIHVPWTWTSFIAHFSSNDSKMNAIPEEGSSINLVPNYKLDFIPAHYLHASGNNHLYDKQAKILFSGDVGAALLPDDGDHDIFVQDFDSHVQYMESFHRRWMPSNKARDIWITRVRALEIDMICPQHGSIFKGEDVGRFLDWFSSLKLEGAIAP